MVTKKCKITFLLCVVKILLVVEALVDTPDIPGNGVRPQKLAPNKVFIVFDVFMRDIPADCLCTIKFMSSTSELNSIQLTKRLEKRKKIILKCNMGSSSRHMLSASAYELIMDYLE